MATMFSEVSNDAGAPLLQVRDLGVSFPTAQAGPIEVLHDVSFELRRGEIVGLLGESGSGKSTLALGILRVLPADARISGSIAFNGRDLLLLSEREMRQV